jgi:hypothetical protein
MFANSFEVIKMVMDMEQKRINHNNLKAINNIKSRKRDLCRRLRK